MGYLDYTLAKLNATKALEDARYRDRQLQEANKAQFISSLVGLVPQAIGGVKDIADKQAAAEQALALQSAALGVEDPMQDPIQKRIDKVLAESAPTKASVPMAEPTITGVGNAEEDDASLPGSERVGITPDVSKLAPALTEQAKIEASKKRLAAEEAANKLYNDEYARSKGFKDEQDFLRKTGPGGSPLPTAGAKPPYSITGGIVSGSVRRLESDPAAAGSPANMGLPPALQRLYPDMPNTAVPMPDKTQTLPAPIGADVSQQTLPAPIGADVSQQLLTAPTAEDDMPEGDVELQEKAAKKKPEGSTGAEKDLDPEDEKLLEENKKELAGGDDELLSPAPAAKEPVSYAEQAAKEAMDLRKQEQELNDRLIDKVAKYKPIDKSDFKEPSVSVLADREIAKLFDRPPSQNPILNFLSQMGAAGQDPRQQALVRSIAKKQMMKAIQDNRNAIAEKHRKDYIEEAKLESQIQDRAARQRIAAGKEAAKEAKGNRTIYKPQAASDLLAGHQVVQNVTDDIFAATEALADNKENIPQGAAFVLAKAKALAKAATPSESKSASASLGAALGSVGINFSVGAQATKDEVLAAAADAISRAKMSPLQSHWLQVSMLGIQQIGKAKEGKALTDRDFGFYEKNIFTMDKGPREFLDSLQYVRKYNARSQNQAYDIFAAQPGVSEVTKAFKKLDSNADKDKFDLVRGKFEGIKLTPLDPDVAAALNVKSPTTLGELARGTGNELLVAIRDAAGNLAWAKQEAAPAPTKQIPTPRPKGQPPKSSGPKVIR